MLSPADRALAAREPALPGLAVLLDAGRLAGMLGLPAITRPYLRYKPGTKCVLAFGEGAEARLAMAYPADRYAMLRGRQSLARAGAAVHFFDNLCLAVIPASLDRDLRALGKFADEAAQQRLLAGLLGAVAEGARLRLLRHNPNRRAVLRLDGADGPLALGKVHAAGEWARTLRNARLAEARGGPRVLGVVERRRLILHEWVVGRPLDHALPSAGVEAAGAALAQLHLADPGDAQPLTAAEEREGLAAAARMLAQLLPDLGPRAETLAREVAERLEDTAPRLLHGDFSADQVVLGPAGPVLIDWDRAALGDPARDLGSFLARLDVQVIDGALTPADAATAGRALRAGYVAEAPLPPGIATQQARALLALLPEGFRQRRPDWPERAAAILDHVAALLPRVPAEGDALAPLLTRAMEAAPLVAAAAGLPPDMVSPPVLLREKPGRRALLRYEAEDGALLGKLRAKGPDRRTPALHTALRAAGLDARAPHRVGVPRPRGAVEALNLWLQDEVPGLRVTHHLHPDGDTHAAFRAGEALALLHARPVETTRRWALAEEVAVLERALSDTAAQLPGKAQRLHDLTAEAGALAATLPPARETGIHRDWYPDQMLLDGGTAWLLDLDLYARGDVAVDLGNFLAHLTDLAIRRHGAADALAAHEAAFLAGYADAGGSVDASRTGVLKALSLARLVAVSQRIADRRVATGDILRAAEAGIAAARLMVRA